MACKFTGSFDEAEVAYRRALALAEAGPTDFGLLASLLHNLAAWSTPGNGPKPASLSPGGAWRGA